MHGSIEAKLRRTMAWERLCVRITLPIVYLHRKRKQLCPESGGARVGASGRRLSHPAQISIKFNRVSTQNNFAAFQSDSWHR